jgi:hypothetical protein
MRQPLPGVAATARLVGKALLVAVVLVMTLLLGQLVMQPAPVPAPPQGPVTPPIPGRDAERAHAGRVSGGRGGRPTHRRRATTRRPRYTLKRMWSTSPSRTA